MPGGLVLPRGAPVEIVRAALPTHQAGIAAPDAPLALVACAAARERYTQLPDPRMATKQLTRGGTWWRVDDSDSGGLVKE